MARLQMYMVLATREPVEQGDKLSELTEFCKLGLHASVEEAESSLSEVRPPPEFAYLSIVKVVVSYYVAVDDIADDEMARRARLPDYAPKIHSGPYETSDEAEMHRLLVDREDWRGVLVLAMDDESAKKLERTR